MLHQTTSMHSSSEIKIKFNGHLNITLLQENKRIDSMKYMHIHFCCCYWVAMHLCEQAFYENTSWTKRERKSNGGTTAEDTHMYHSSPIFDIVKLYTLRHTTRSLFLFWVEFEGKREKRSKLSFTVELRARAWRPIPAKRLSHINFV